MEEIRELTQELSVIQEAMLDLFGRDPVNWVKWCCVFAVLILGYIWLVRSKWVDRVFNRWTYRREKARRLGHVIPAVLTDSYPSGDGPNYDWHAKYTYKLDGEEKTYRALFMHSNYPPRNIELNYISSPRRLFCVEEYHWDGFRGIFMFFLTLSPFFLAALTAILLKIDLPR